MANSCHFHVTCLILGDPYSGKTTFFHALCDEKTVGDFKGMKQFVTVHHEHPMYITNWKIEDTYSEDWDFLPQILKRQMLVLLCIDLSKTNVIQGFTKWMDKIQKHNQGLKEKFARVFVICTKSDRMSVAEYEALREYIFIHHKYVQMVSVIRKKNEINNIPEIRRQITNYFYKDIYPHLKPGLLQNDQYRTFGVCYGRLHNDYPPYKDFESLVHEQTTLAQQQEKQNIYMCSNCIIV